MTCETCGGAITLDVTVNPPVYRHRDPARDADHRLTIDLRNWRPGR